MGRIEGIEGASYSTEQEACEAAARANAAIQARPKNAQELIGVLKGIMAECMYCGEYGCGGRAIGCGFEVLKAHPKQRGARWELVRERCMLRSWVEAEATGCDPFSSELGTAEEWDDAWERFEERAAPETSYEAN